MSLLYACWMYPGIGTVHVNEMKNNILSLSIGKRNHSLSKGSHRAGKKEKNWGPTYLYPLSLSYLYVATFTFLPECSSGQRDQILFWNRRESPLRQAPLLPDDFHCDVVMIMMIILVEMVMIMMIRIRFHKKIQPKGVILDKNTKRPD